MYRVVAVLNGTEHTLMDIRDEKYMLTEPKLTLQINNAGIFTFSIYPTHPEVKSIISLVTIVKVYKTDYRTYEKWMFSGRVISNESDIYNNGRVKCEGILAYLIDSIVYPYEYQGTPADYVRQMINSHNSQVDQNKQFALRTLDLSDVDTNNNIVRANKNYPTTMQEMKDKVISLLNAYVSAEEVGGKLYIDCSQSIMHYNKQDIRLGENIIDLTKTQNAGSIRTIMIGIGAEDKEGNRPAVTVENSSAIAKFGRIVGTVEFDNVTTLAQLEKKTKAYLDSIITEANTIEVRAMDLSMTNTEIESIELGYCYVESKYNDLDHVRMLVSKIELHLTDPGQNNFVLGAAARSMTSGVSHANAEIDKMVNRIASSISPRIHYAVDNATQLITGAQGGYVILDCGENADKHPEQILIMDAPEKENATNVIRINKNGIGFSTTGYDGPYANAWTIDGNLVADFITTGTMFADRIRGGTLEIGGERDGVITVIDKNRNTVALIDKEGITIYKGSIRGSTIVVGGAYNADGSITVLDSSGKTVVTIDRDGITVSKGSIRGSTITVGGSYNSEGKITVLDRLGKTVAVIDEDGVTVNKGSIRGSTITVGGTSNSDGKITVLDSSGKVRITIDVNGINVNDKFKVDMNGNMEAISISGDAVDQISDIIDESNAMKTAKKAIKTAQSAADTAQKAADTAQKAADTAQSTADTANRAAATAQSAANTAQSAANTANSAAATAKKTADDANALAKAARDAADACDAALKNLDARVKALEK